jgi:NADH oxidase (H2O2-forming)
MPSISVTFKSYNLIFTYMTKIVILGLGTAGFAAALAIKKIDRKAKITIIDKTCKLLHPCGLPYALEGLLNFKELEHEIAPMGIEFIKEDAKEIITKEKKVITETIEVEYDKLIISTGSLPFTPPIKINSDIIHTVSKITDTKKLVKAKGNAIVIGAGAIGLEIAIALSKTCKVTVVDMLSSILPKAIDQDLSDIIVEKLNINFKLGKKLRSIQGNKVELEDETLKADVIVLAAGTRPNIRIADNAGITIGKHGIEVDDKMQTSVKDVFAAGDCAEILSLLSQEKYNPMIATSAYKQGTVAGTNAVSRKATYIGALSTFVTLLGDVEIAATGFNEFFARQYGYDVIVGKSKSTNKPSWFPGFEEITLKIIADKKTKKVIGCQAVGKGASTYVNVVSTAISASMSLQELSDVELAYCPAVSQCYNVMHQAVDLAVRKL